MYTGMGEEHGRPHQRAVADKHRGEQPGGKNSQNSREYGDGSEQVKDAGRHRPELLSRRNPLRDHAGGERKGKKVRQAV